jgi:hypothetical protein
MTSKTYMQENCCFSPPKRERLELPETTETDFLRALYMLSFVMIIKVV